jgi:hypothetical protein
MSNIAFLTTVFPQNEEFLKDFFESLSRQTFRDFDLVIINNNLKNLNYYKNVYSKLRIIDINSSGSIAKNRELGINYCIEKKYDVLIFGDSDDYFKNNRVEKSLELLKKKEVIVNDLSIFNKYGVYEKKYLSNRLKNLDIIDYEFIKDKNIFGMSNTAIKLKNISKVIFDDNIIPIDWFFFRAILKQGLKALFTNETETFYRQHKNNTVGLRVKNDKYYLWWEK